MKNKLINFIMSFIYIIVFLILQVILKGFYARIVPNISSILSSITIICIYIAFKFNDVINDIKNINKTHFKKNLIIFIIMFSITETCSIIFPKIFNIMITNQNNIIDSMNNYPVIAFIESCLLAPIYEEVLFRKNFKKSFNNKWLFIIVTSILFGGIHCLTIKNALELIYAPLYILLGGTLGYIYYNDDNILSSIKYHMINNVIAFILLMII